MHIYSSPPLCASHLYDYSTTRLDSIGAWLCVAAWLQNQVEVLKDWKHFADSIYFILFLWFFLIQPWFPSYLLSLSGVCTGCFISKICYENSLWKFSRFPVLFLCLASCLIHSALQRLMWLSLETDQTKYFRPTRADRCFWVASEHSMSGGITSV